MSNNNSNNDWAFTILKVQKIIIKCIRVTTQVRIGKHHMRVAPTVCFSIIFSITYRDSFMENLSIIISFRNRNPSNQLNDFVIDSCAATKCSRKKPNNLETYETSLRQKIYSAQVAQGG